MKGHRRLTFTTWSVGIIQLSEVFLERPRMTQHETISTMNILEHIYYDLDVIRSEVDEKDLQWLLICGSYSDMVWN